MSLIFKIALFVLALCIAILWQLSLAPPLGLAFLNLVLLGGLIAAIKNGSKVVILWVILGGLFFDLLTSRIVGPYLLSYFLALIVWPYLFFRIFETQSAVKQLFLGAGAVLTFELALLGMHYVLFTLNLSQLWPIIDVVYLVHLIASTAVVSALYLVFGRASKDLGSVGLLHV